MGRLPISADVIDNNKHHKKRKDIDKREVVENNLKNTRQLICPPYLTQDAKDKWEEIVAIDSLRSKPIIYDSDKGALEQLCELWSQWCSARRGFAKFQEIQVKDRDGKMRENPYAVSERKIAQAFKSLWTMFGLTPQGRSQFGVDFTKLEETDLSDLFFGE